MSSLSLLLIEDDLALQEELKSFMENFFSFIDTTDNAVDALSLYSKKHYDLILTDIQLPTTDGLSLVKSIKQQNKNQMVIVMSAYKETEYFLRSIELQIFSFLVKPFSSEELLQTIFKATKILEKSKKEPQSNTKKILSYNVFYDVETRYLYVDDSLVMLTKKEEKLLYLLIKHIDSHVSEEQMQKEIWENENVADSTIRVLIKRLREKLGYEDAIINLKGRGYKIIPNI
jgi:DNA-binding response OmpR family regulator